MGLRKKRPKLGGAVYILPNLLTTGNLFFGFFSVVKALQGDFGWAASAILLATIFDVLDGRVARMTGGTSEFGVQYDSLCDIISFGLAPAFLMYQARLNELGRLGWIVCFMFLACGALRLARFNVQSSIGKASGDFTGLPIPMAAGLIACFVALSADFRQSIPRFDFLKKFGDFLLLDFVQITCFVVFGIGLALAMVSNIPYRSHKGIKIRGIKPFRLLVILVALVGLIAYAPELIGFWLFFLYALSGPLEWMLGWKKPVDDDEIFAPEAEDHDDEAEYSNHPADDNA